VIAITDEQRQVLVEDALRCNRSIDRSRGLQRSRSPTRAARILTTSSADRRSSEHAKQSPSNAARARK
jgi:hypothetical protein